MLGATHTITIRHQKGATAMVCPYQTEAEVINTRTPVGVALAATRAFSDGHPRYPIRAYPFLTRRAAARVCPYRGRAFSWGLFVIATNRTTKFPGRTNHFPTQIGRTRTIHRPSYLVCLCSPDFLRSSISIAPPKIPRDRQDPCS